MLNTLHLINYSVQYKCTTRQLRNENPHIFTAYYRSIRACFERKEFQLNICLLHKKILNLFGGENSFSTTSAIPNILVF